MAAEEAKWICCFCGGGINRQGTDPCLLSVHTADEKPQWWHCHGACFKERMAKQPAVIYDPPKHF